MLNDRRLHLKHIDDKGNFAGYASVFNVVDNQNDMMLEGAFAATLADGKQQVKLLWQHNMDEPIGVFTLLREDARGLYVEGRLLLDVQRAKEAHALLKAGAIAGLSIGYVPIDYRIDPLTGVRLLEEVALYEISLVTFPANAEATVHAVKQVDVSLSRLAEALERASAVLIAM